MTEQLLQSLKAAMGLDLLAFLQRRAQYRNQAKQLGGLMPRLVHQRGRDASDAEL